MFVPVWVFVVVAVIAYGFYKMVIDTYSKREKEVSKLLNEIAKQLDSVCTDPDEIFNSICELCKDTYTLESDAMEMSCEIPYPDFEQCKIILNRRLIQERDLIKKSIDHDCNVINSISADLYDNWI